MTQAHVRSLKRDPALERARRPRRALLLALPLAAMLLGPAPARAADAFATMQDSPNMTLWAQWISVAGLADYARKSGPYTAFVPTNEALSHVPSSHVRAFMPQLVELFPDTSKLQAVIRARVVAGLHPLSEISGARTVFRSVSGLPITVDASNPNRIIVTFAGVTSRIAGPPISTDNALIYPVDRIELDTKINN